MIALAGPSPSGKSTLLKCIAGLEAPTSGSIYIDGEDVVRVPAHKRDIALVFQNFALFPHMTVFDNIAFGLRMLKRPKDVVKKEVEEAMKLVALEGLGERYPRQLSGGQQQRVALARALVVKPKILLLDEPLGNVDPRLRVRLLEEIKMLHEKLGFTGLYVTHDQAQAMTIADKIMIMNMGKIEQVGAPEEIYNNPKSVMVAKFFGSINLFEGIVQKVTKGMALVKTGVGEFEGPVRDEEVKAGAKVAYGIRPEKVAIGEEAKDRTYKVEAEILTQVYKGAFIEYLVRLSDGTEFKILQEGNIGSIKVDKNLRVGWNAEDANVIAKPSVVPGVDISRIILGE
jgi:ABC-type Fe3+/spermidine/putrescine transport system ATPase subunit